MHFYKIDDKVIPSKDVLNTGEELIPNTTDAAGEKHVPVVSKDGENVKVQVGSVEHPMLEAHFIQFILIETAGGYQVKYLKPGEKPEASFKVSEDVTAAYEYCNLHGLWKS
ncbi:MAG: desulfoferrodoxin Dfx [Lachnospiraceae bacterium]|nr:desulfoferrodoxin Dfx [Lachnospiraceae bacterium]